MSDFKTQYFKQLVGQGILSENEDINSFNSYLSTNEGRKSFYDEMLKRGFGEYEGGFEAYNKDLAKHYDSGHTNKNRWKSPEMENYTKRISDELSRWDKYTDKLDWTDGEYQRFAIAKNNYQNVLKGIKHLQSDDNFFVDAYEGFTDAAGDRDFRTMGFSDAQAGYYLYDLSKKFDEDTGHLKDGEKLTPGEQAILTSFMNKQWLDENSDYDIGYSIGSGAAQSIPFMAQFAATGGVGAIAGKGAVKILSKAAKKLVGKELKNRVLKKGVGMAAGAYAQSALMPSTHGDIGRNRAGRLEQKEDGSIGFDPDTQMSLGEAGWRALSNNAAEVAVEKMGGEFLGKAIKSGVTKILGERGVTTLSKMKPVQIVKKFTTGFGDSKFSKVTGFDGYLPEVAEEYIVAPLKDLLNWEYNETRNLVEGGWRPHLEILGTTALVTGIMGGGHGIASQPKRIAYKRKLNKEYKKQLSELSEFVKEDELNTLNKAIESRSPEEIAKVFDPLLYGMNEFSKEQKNTMKAYISVKLQKEGIALTLQEHVANLFNEQTKLVNELTNKNGQFIKAKDLNDDEVFIKPGAEIRVKSDGSVDYDNSEKSIVIVDKLGNNEKMVALSSLSDIQVINTEDFSQKVKENIESQVAAQDEAESAEEPLQQGERVTVKVNGTETQGEITGIDRMQGMASVLLGDAETGQTKDFRLEVLERYEEDREENDESSLHSREDNNKTTTQDSPKEFNVQLGKEPNKMIETAKGEYRLDTEYSTRKEAEKRMRELSEKYEDYEWSVESEKGEGEFAGSKHKVVAKKPVLVENVEQVEVDESPIEQYEKLQSNGYDVELIRGEMRNEALLLRKQAEQLQKEAAGKTIEERVEARQQAKELEQKAQEYERLGNKGVDAVNSYKEKRNEALNVDDAALPLRSLIAKYFLSGGRVNTNDVKTELGFDGGSAEFRSALRLVSNDAPSIDGLEEILLQSYNEEQGEAVKADTNRFRNELIDVLSSVGTGRVNEDLADMVLEGAKVGFESSEDAYLRQSEDAHRAAKQGLLNAGYSEAEAESMLKGKETAEREVPEEFVLNDEPVPFSKSRGVSNEQADAILEQMRENAEDAPEMELTVENWDKEFGKDGIVETPMGKVKMGDNQYLKMQRQGRNAKLGMIKPTLTNPDVVVADRSKAKGGQESERESSYVFVKAFKKPDGAREYLFTSVTVSRNGQEVVISNQERRKNRVKSLLKEGSLVHVKSATLPSKSVPLVQGNQSTVPHGATLPTHKNTKLSEKDQKVADKLQQMSAENPRALPVQIVEKQADLDTLKGLGNNTKKVMEVVESQKEKKERNEAGGINAFVANGKVWFVLENIANEQQAKELWIHEQGIHVGLDAVFGVNKSKVLDLVWNYLSNRQGDLLARYISFGTYSEINTEMLLDAFKLGLSAVDKAYKDSELVAEILKDYRGKDFTKDIEEELLDIYKTKQGNNVEVFESALKRYRKVKQREIAEEYLAHLAEKLVKSEQFTEAEQSVWDRFKEILNSFLELMYHTNYTLSDKQVAMIVQSTVAEMNKQGEVIENKENNVKFAKKEKDGISESISQGEYGKEDEEVGRTTEAWEAELRGRITENQRNAQANSENVSERQVVSETILSAFKDAVSGKLKGKPIEVGRLTKQGREYLQELSGLTFKENISFVLNPSDLKHIYNEHYGNNEKDRGSNIPLTDADIKNMADVISNPDKILSFKQDGINKFMFLKEDVKDKGTYNLMEVFSNKRGNLTAKTLYKTKKDVSHRVMTIVKQSKLSTSKTSEAILSDTKVPVLFEKNKSTDEVKFSKAPQAKDYEDAYEFAKAQLAYSRNAKNPEIAMAEAEVDTQPTEKQKEAGNYKKGHVKVQGLDISIEQPKGSVRSGVDKDGKEWSVTMNNTYGYFKGTKGRDGDHIDTFLGDNLESDKVFVIDQVDDKGKFDEHKVMLGFNTEQEAKEAYLSNYSEGWQGLGAITEMNIDELKEWTKTDGKRVKPVSELVRFSKESDKQEFDEIKVQAEKNGTFMKAPNGKPTNLNERQWLQVRTKAFKKWFGDWEKSARIERLKASKPIEISGKEITPSEDLKQYKHNALEYGLKLRKSYTNKDTGREIELGRKGVKEVLNHDYKDVEHLQSMAAIPQIIEGAVYIDTLPNGDVQKRPDVKEYEYYVTGLKIGGVDYTVRAVVAVSNTGDKYYDHKLSQIEKGNLLSITSRTTPEIESDALSNAKDIKLLSLLQTDASKVVDENGEPMVVYHGTSKEFNEFNISNDGDFGKGIYFTTDMEDAESYAAIDSEMAKNKNKKVYSLFLSIKNPYTPSNFEWKNHTFDSFYDENDSLIDTRKILVDRGYDGVLVMAKIKTENGFIKANAINKDNVLEIIAFTPSQIKSATDNVGTFDEGNEDIRFSKSITNEELKITNERFNSDLYRLKEGTLPKGHIFQLGRPMGILRSVGMPNLPIELSADRLKRKSEQENHPFDLTNIVNLPQAIQEPIMVFDSKTVSATDVVLTELSDGEKNFVVVLRVSHKGAGRNNIQVNDIKSLYPKDGKQIIKWIEQGDLLKYANKEKAAEFISVQSTNLIGNGNKNSNFSIAKVMENFENPKSDDVRFSIIGKRGAKELDKQEERTHRMDNLQVAREMETANKDVKAIRIATGWERGADGRWRYEISDELFTVKGDKWENLEINTPVKLENIVKNADELFSAYPELRDIDIVKEELTDSGGYYGGGKIAISTTWKGYKGDYTDINTVLLHEIQHAIQDIEGFVGGESIEGANSNYDRYHRNMGEVESRNVQYRMYFDDVERRSYLLSETEDVAREDQLFLREGFISGEEMGFIIGEKNGVYREYDEDGLLERETEYKDGQKNGVEIDYDENGDIVGFYTFNDGYLDGISLSFYDGASSDVMMTKYKKEEIISEEDISIEDAMRYIEDYKQNLDINIRFSKSTKNDELGIANERFNLELDRFTKGAMKSNEVLHLGKPMDILRSVGIDTDDIYVKQSTLRHKIAKHGFTANDLKGLAGAIQMPIMVYDWGSKAKARMLITEMKYGDNNMAVALKLERDGRRLEINEISSFYPKDITRFINEVNTDLSKFENEQLKYVNKEKALEWLGSVPSDGEQPTTKKGFSITNIVKEFENPKTESELLQEGLDGLIRFSKQAPPMPEKPKAEDYEPFEQLGQAHRKWFSDMEGWRKANDKYQAEKRTYKEKWMEMVFDKYRTVKKLQEDVEKAIGRKLSDNENAYVKEMLRTAQGKQEMEDFQEHYMTPLSKAVKALQKKAKVKYKDVVMYMLAKHAVERNAYMAEHKDVEDGSGIETKEAEQIVKEFEAKADKSSISELWSKVNKATRYALDKQYHSGLLSLDLYKHIKGMYKHYVPMRGWDEETSGDLFDYMNRPFPKSSLQKMKEAKGRSSLADDPIPYIASMAESSILMGGKNEVRQALLKMVRNHPHPELYGLQKVWMVNKGTKETPEWVEELYKPSDEVIKSGMAYEKRNEIKGHKVTPMQAQAHQVEVWENGRKLVMDFVRPDIAAAVKGENVQRGGMLDNVLNKASGLTRMLSRNFTSRNPSFTMVNMGRDMIYATIMNSVKHGSGKEFIGNVGKCGGSLRRMIFNKSWDGKGNEVDGYLKEFLQMGGETGFLYLRDIEAHRKEIRRMLKNLRDPNFLNSMEQAGMSVLEFVEKGNRWAEDLSRFTTYYTLRKRGMTPQQAAYEAKEITVNFNRQGTIGSFVGSLYAFFNAAMQGVYNFGDAAVKNKKAVGGVAFGMFALGALMPIFNRLLGGSDDEGNYYYDMLPDYERSNHLIIVIGNGNTIKIPLPHILRAFYGWGESIDGYRAGKKDASETVRTMIGNFVDDLSPVSLSGGGLRALMPTAVIPFYDNMVNENFAGYQVYEEPFLKSQEGKIPQYDLASNYTNEILVAISKLSNKLGGGSDNRSASIRIKNGEPEYNWIGDKFDWNPSKVEHIIEHFGGGVLTFLNNTYKLGSHLVGANNDFEAKNMPIARRFYRKAKPKSIASQYFDLKKENENYEYFLKKDKADGNHAEYTEMLRNTPRYRQMQILKIFDKQLKKYRKMEEMAGGNETMLQDIEKKKEQLYKQAVRQIKELKQAE